MALACIVFDCDGVILEAASIKWKGYSHISAEYGEEAQQRLLDYHAERGGVSRLLKFEWFYREVLGLEPQPEEIKAMDGRFCAFCDAALAAAPYVPGFIETFTAWRGRLPLYVASGSPHGDMEKLLRPRGILEGFAGAYGSPPAKTELLRGIIERGGYDPAQTLMVGDARVDFEAARLNGTLFYGRGEYFADKNCPWGPDLSGLSDYIASLV